MLRAGQCVQFTQQSRDGRRGSLLRIDSRCTRIKSVKMGIVELEHPLGGQSLWASIRFQRCSCADRASVRRKVR